MKALFADSFYFLALLRLEASAHARAVAASPNRTERLITTAGILTELADALAVPEIPLTTEAPRRRGRKT